MTHSSRTVRVQDKRSGNEIFLYDRKNDEINKNRLEILSEHNRNTVDCRINTCSWVKKKIK